MDLYKNDVNFRKSSSGVLTLNDANIKGFGKSNVDLSRNEIILKALESTFEVSKSVNDIDFLIYSKGNFFFDDTIYMGIGGEQYEITCKNDEIGLRNLYDNLVRTKAKNTPSKPILQQNNQTNINHTNDLSPPEEENKVSTSEEIRNFYNLMKDGIISEEEFEEKKKELLKSK